MASLLLVGILVGFLATNVPVAVTFGLTAALFLILATDVPLALIPQQMFGGRTPRRCRPCRSFCWWTP
jgi:hypothetical protein